MEGEEVMTETGPVVQRLIHTVKCVIQIDKMKNNAVKRLKITQ